jgi:hypothetical protein
MEYRIVNLMLFAPVVTAVALMGGAAFADVYRVDFDTPSGTQKLGQALTAADSVLARGVSSVAGDLRNVVAFQSNAPEIAVSLSWSVGTDFRVVGVNLDLVGPDDVVLATDGTPQLVAGVAVSTLAFDKLKRDTPYRLIIRGDIVSTGVYTLGMDVNR